MSKWYALFASGEDGAGITDWQLGSYLGMEEDLINQVGYSEYVGSALVIEVEMPDGVEPPSLSCWPIDLNIEEEEDE